MSEPFSTLEHIPWATMGRPETSREFFGKCSEQTELAGHLAYKPFFSIVWQPSKAHPLQKPAIKKQSYPQWELLEDASQAKGDWVIFLGPNQIPSPCLLFFIASELQKKSDAQLFYFNEIHLHEKKMRFYSKPSFSWFNLVHFNFIGDTFAVKRAAFQDLKGFAPFSFPYSFFLTLSELTKEFHLVPYFLVYQLSPSHPIDFAEATKAVDSHLKRIRFPAVVREAKDVWHVVPKISVTEKKLSVVVCFRDRVEWTLQCLENLLERRGEAEVELILVDNQSRAGVEKTLISVLKTKQIKYHYIHYDAPFNFAEMNTLGVSKASGDFVFLLNNDVFLTEGYLDELIAWASLDWVGTVGIRLHYADGNMQHAGIRAFFGGLARLARVGHDQSEEISSYFNKGVYANTFAACVMRRELFTEIGLPSWRFPNGFGDVAFNLECKKKGLENIYLGGFSGTHLESASRGENFEYWEECELERLYPDLLQKMLREDLGWDRTPGADLSLRRFINEWVRHKARAHTPWLKPTLKNLKKIIEKRGKSYVWTHRTAKNES